MWLRFPGIIFAGLFSLAAHAQEPIVIANVVELSGGGASNGVNWKMALELAADEINDVFRASFLAEAVEGQIKIIRALP